MTLRTDGVWTFYIVEFEIEPGRWVAVGGEQFKHVPPAARWNQREQRDVEPFRTFSANGAVWQETGIDGSFDVEPAMRLAFLLSKYCTKYAYRVARMTVGQARDPVTVIPRCAMGAERAKAEEIKQAFEARAASEGKKR